MLGVTGLPWQLVQVLALPWLRGKRWLKLAPSQVLVPWQDWQVVGKPACW